ncbi:MAG: hypothetical protein ACR2NT_08335 [Acidimicrobiia bacterium]
MRQVRWVVGAGARHLPDLPEGYHTAPRAQAWQDRPAVGWHAAPRVPRGRALPGRGDGASGPAWSGDGAFPERTAYPSPSRAGTGRHEPAAHPAPDDTGRWGRGRQIRLDTEEVALAR